MKNTNDRLIRIEQVLSEIGIKKTNLYELIKLFRNAIDEKILTGAISKNELKKMIRKNLKTVYARN